MATCFKCNSSVPDDAQFCGGCGARMERAGGSTVAAAPISSALVESTMDEGNQPASIDPATVLPVGALVDQKYAVVRILGQGGMGVVYLARDVHTDAPVVLKAVRRELAHRPDIRQRMLAEGRALAQIDHLNVVRLNAVVAQGEDLWLVMQYIDGETLDRIIAAGQATGGMPIDRAVALFRQIAAGVGAAHKEGVIHRDLKPANVIVRKKDGVAKVMDFGIAKVPDRPDGAITKGIIGSLWYMAPEQVTGRRDLDARVDVYALGILFYQMLVGRVPFQGASEYEIMKAQAEAPMPFARALRPSVPAEIDAAIQRACRKDRAERFASCDDLIAALDLAFGRAAPISADASGGYPRSELIVSSGHSTPIGSSFGGPGVTATGTELSIDEAASNPGSAGARPHRRSSAWIAVPFALLAIAGGGAAAVLTGAIAAPWDKHTPASPSHDAGATTAAVTATAKSPLESLAGAWTGNGRELDAVPTGDVIEFRVKNPAEFAPQDYQAGEARFLLRATSDPNVFLVEDRIRPNPPPGRAFDAHSRGTCQEVWSQAGAEPLRARYDGARLSVEFAKIEPSEDNFVPRTGKITSCVGLRALKTVKVVSTLSR